MKTFHLLCLILVVSFIHITEITAQTQLVQYDKMVSSVRRNLLGFGSEVDMSDHYFAISSPKEDYDANNENYIPQAGAVYVYRYDSTGEHEFIQKLVAPLRGEDELGYSVAITDEYALAGSPKGNYYVNGAENTVTGQANLYKRLSDDTWEHVVTLYHPDTTECKYFGNIVAMRDDILLIESFCDICVYRRRPDDEVSLIQQISIGFWNDIEFDGQGLLIADGEFVRYFRLETDTFSEIQLIYQEDLSSMAVQGNTMVLGAGGDDFDENGVGYVESAGAIYIYTLNEASGLWELSAKKVAGDRAAYAIFGKSVSLFNEYIAVGAPGIGTDVQGENFVAAAGGGYLFRRTEDGGWSEECKFVANDRNFQDNLGYDDIANRGRLVLISSTYVDDDENGGNPIDAAGAAYFFGPEQPEILRDLSSQTACEGDALINLEIKAIGADLNYIWFKDGTELSNTTGNSCLITTSVQNSGLYHCVIENGMDSVSSDSVSISIVPLTKIVIQPESMTDCEDAGSFELSIGSLGSDISFQWFRDDVLLTGEESSLLVLNKVPDNSAKYYCLVEGFCGSEVSDTAHIDIHPLNIITKIPEDQVLCARYDSLVLTVEHMGDASAYFWKNDAGFDSTTYIPTIRIPLSPLYSGAYDVIVDGECSTALSDEFVITILDTLNILQEPEQVTAYPGDPVYFTITASGDSISYQWQLNGSILTDTDIISGTNSDTLYIEYIEDADAGEYSCRLLNSCGELLSNTAQLSVLESVREFGARGISVWPNPASEGVLYLKGLPFGGSVVKVMSLDGSLILSEIITIEDPAIDVSELKPGIYMLVLIKDGQHITTLIGVQ